MRFPWDKKLDEAVREQRGKLAEAVVRNDRVRHRLALKASERPVSDMLNDMFSRLDGTQSHD